MKTVFFGPWVGEFGWEILWWHGWVRNLCRTVFKDHRKVVSSFPGRYPFYPEADEFWPHPEWFIARRFSGRAYITDYWRGGRPRGNANRKRLKYFVKPTLESVAVDPAVLPPDAELAAEKLLSQCLERLPDDTMVCAPFRLNVCPKSGIKVGMEIPEQPATDSDFRVHVPPFDQQTLEPLEPSAAARARLDAFAPAGERLVAVFPRSRAIRRPDKNWSREKYDRLIALLRERLPRYPIALLGEPGGTCYPDGIPAGCIDLINVDREMRMDLQGAALRRSVVAVGGMSGALLFALACRCPALIFGHRDEEKLYFEANYLRTKLVYLSLMQADPADVAALAAAMVEGRIPGQPQEQWDALSYFGTLGRVRRRLQAILGS